MPVTIVLPTALRQFTGGKERVDVTAETVGAALQALATEAPRLTSQIFDSGGSIRSFVNVYLGDEDTRYLEGARTPVSEGDVLTIVPSIAGG
jgi:adenylyltransferase/sulfurtransferase